MYFHYRPDHKLGPSSARLGYEDRPDNVQGELPDSRRVILFKGHFEGTRSRIRTLESQEGVCVTPLGKSPETFRKLVGV